MFSARALAFEINPPSTIVSPSATETVVWIDCWLKAVANWPLPRGISESCGEMIFGSTRIRIRPSGLMRGVTVSVVPIVCCEICGWNVPSEVN